MTIGKANSKTDSKTFYLPLILLEHKSFITFSGRKIVLNKLRKFPTAATKFVDTERNAGLSYFEL